MVARARARSAIVASHRRQAKSVTSLGSLFKNLIGFLIARVGFCVLVTLGCIRNLAASEETGLSRGQIGISGNEGARLEGISSLDQGSKAIIAIIGELQEAGLN